MDNLRSKKLIGKLLVDKGLISESEIHSILQIQRVSKRRFGELLIETGYISEDDLYNTLSEQLEIPFIPFSDFPEAPPPGVDIPLQFMKQYKFYPLEVQDTNMTVVMTDPLDLYTIDDLQLSLGYRLKVFLASESDILKAIDLHYGSGRSGMDDMVDEAGEEDLEFLGALKDEDIDHLLDMAQEAPVIKLVNLILRQAVDKDASDIHIEPFEDDMRVRYRIDGVLHSVERVPRHLQAAITSRIKIMADLNIAERRLPQDGRIRARIAGKKIDLRVSTIPTMHGESVVMRLLEQGNVLLTLEDLGFPLEKRIQFETLIQQPHGIILVTGPTGSGKTTTLYAALEKINTPERKIITVEDPVEYQIGGINQIQVKSKIGLTFSSGLRSIVRQDPDIIMIGEIRDLETAEIAVQSALTGHLVFSTLHTNDAPGAITRLLDMGAENYLISSCVIGILAQRLVRMICPTCKESYEPDTQTIDEIGKNIEIKGKPMFYRGSGCKECSKTGYRGRQGIYEMMLIDDDIRALILGNISSTKIKKKALESGMETLREDGWRKVLDGQTTIEEVVRVTQEEDIVMA